MHYHCCNLRKGLSSHATCGLLQELAAPTAITKRDNTWMEIPARELVPGDLIQLKGGDVIPADAKVSILKAAALLICQRRVHMKDTGSPILQTPGICQPALSLMQQATADTGYQTLNQACADRRKQSGRRVVQLVGEGEPMKIDESSLTGESLAVTRKPGQQVSCSLLHFLAHAGLYSAHWISK